MNESLELSRTEIAAFTRAHTRARQLAFLRQNGIRHYVDLHGWPVVTRVAIEGMPEAKKPTKEWKPNKAA